MVMTLSPCVRASLKSSGSRAMPPLVVQHLADHAHRGRAGQPREVHRRLGMAGAAEHAAGQRAEREDVAGAVEVLRTRGGVDEGADGDGAIVGGDAGGDAAAGVHGGGEGGADAAPCCRAPSGRSRGRRGARPSMGTQMRPRPYRAMKFTASGVTRSAAMRRSPSFSRSSSSTTTSIRPARISSMASSMVENSPTAPRARSLVTIGLLRSLPPFPARERESRTCRSCPSPSLRGARAGPSPASSSPACAGSP